MPAPAVGAAVASIGGSLLSGGAQRRAAARATAAANMGNDKAIATLLPAIRGGTDARLQGIADASGRVDAATAAQLGGLTDARGNIAGATAAAVGGYDAAAANEVAGMGRIRDLLKPYVNSGNQGLSGLLALMGLNGMQAQSDAISGIKSSAQFSELAKQQEQALLANASATGGLRGGDTQSALASSRVNLLQGLIDKQLAGLGGLATLGGNAANNLSGFEQNSTNALSGFAVGRGNAQAQGQVAFGQNSIDAANAAAQGQLTQADLAKLRGETQAQGIVGAGQATSDFFLNKGAIESGGQLATGQANANMWGGIAQGVGSVFGNMAPVGTAQQMQQYPNGYAQQPAFGGMFGNFGFAGAR